jgi:hypothetical protein
LKVRIGIICTTAPDFWNTYKPQSESIIRVRTLTIPDLPPGWVVERVMLFEQENKEEEE